MIRRWWPAAVVVFAACSKELPDGRQEHPAGYAQDSAIAASKLPGATGVKRAMSVADSAQARRRLEDSIGRP